MALHLGASSDDSGEVLGCCVEKDSEAVRLSGKGSGL